jgi:hypothetical protein
MPYRSDLDALEARYEALNAEVQDRTRERDEVAAMVSEARARHDAAMYERNRRQRRRDRHVALSVIATTTVVVAGIVAAGLAKSHSRDRHHERVLAEFTEFVDRTCACTDRACGEKVADDMNKWAMTMASKPDTEMPSASIMHRYEEVTKRYADCMTRVFTPDPASLPQ